MKSASMLLILLLAGCASSFRVDPSRIGVKADTPTVHCGSADKEVRAIINLKNKGRALLKIWVRGTSGPPYEIAWHSYDVLNADGGVDWKHGPGGHGPLLSSTLSIGPGDSTTLWASIYQLTPDMYQSKYKIRMEDQDGNTYITDAFQPCVL